MLCVALFGVQRARFGVFGALFLLASFLEVEFNDGSLPNSRSSVTLRVVMRTISFR